MFAFYIVVLKAAVLVGIFLSAFSHLRHLNNASPRLFAKKLEGRKWPRTSCKVPHGNRIWKWMWKNGNI